MKKATRLTALLLAAVMTAGLGGCAKGGKPSGDTMISASRYIGQARGFLVQAGAAGDFPGENTTLEQQQTQLRELVETAAGNKLNTIFFEARPGATAFYQSKAFPLDRSVAKGEKSFLDPLEYLCQEAAAGRVQVFAAIRPLAMGGTLPDGAKNPFGELPISGDWLDPRSEKLHQLTADSAAQLVKKYQVAGILLEGLDASFIQGEEITPAVEALVRAVSAAVRKANPAAQIAISFDAANQHNAMTTEAVERLCQEGAVSLVVPGLNASVDNPSEDGYLALLDRWTSAKLGLAQLYTLNQGQSDNPNELQNQLLANALSGKVSGAVLSPYSLLRGGSEAERSMLVSLLAAGHGQPSLPALPIPQALAVSYPAGAVTVYDKSIYIMGTSDPGQPLTRDGREVPRTGTLGTFGLAVELAVGENTVTLAQGSQTVSVKVTRGSAPAGAAPISKITTGTLFPVTPLGVNSNEIIEIACMGPASASITATLDGQTAVLAQSATAAAGTPTVFRGTITLSPGSYPADQVKNAGRITYVVTYNGGHEVQKSEGEVFVAGKNVPLVLEIAPDSYVASVLTDLSSDDNFTQSLKAGGRAAVASRTKTTRSGLPMIAYKLSDGGYVLGNRVKIVEDPAKCSVEITQIVKSGEGDWEEYAFLGGQPAVLTDYKENKLTLRMLDVKMTADPAVLAGGLVQSVERADTKDGAQLTLTFAPGTLWGYDITHGEESTKLYLRRTPKPSGTFGKPLEGISILLDPGHGGTDPGALGMAGSAGPTEATLNLAAAEAVKFRLEQLGAQVSMTRGDGEAKVTLDDRTFQAQKERPHLFIALHHNSALLVKDLNNVHHMEAYYWEGIAQPLAAGMMDRLEQTMGRTPSEPENAYYYVTRLTFAPAVLFEIGFVVSPSEYEDACGIPSRLKAANGIAMAVTELVAGAGN